MSNKPIFRSIFFILLLALGMYGGGRLFFKLTDGFTMNNIHSEFAYREEWSEPELSEEKRREIKAILNQGYRYLGRGAQAYAFLSEDGNYVLKIVKQKHLKMMAWEKGIFALPFLSNFRDKKIVRMRSKVQNVLVSSKISYEHLKNETALLYLHYKPSNNLNLQVAITDKLGIKHLIDLDNTEFCLQKRAEMALPYLESLLKESTEKTREALWKLIELRKEVSKRGIKDKDTGFLNNMGFIEGKPVIVDIGQFAIDEEIKKPEIFQQDIFRKTRILRSWLKDHQPELARDFEKYLADLSANS